MGGRRLVLTGLFAMAMLAAGPLPAQTSSGFPPVEQQRGMELQRYRDAVRRLFVLKQYQQLLELTEQYGHLYPEDEGTEFYRTQAEIRIQEAERKIPFARLEDRDFKIPEAPEGAPSLLEELRNGAAESAALPGGDPGDLGLEPADDSRIAMGTGQIDEALPLPGGAPAVDPAAPPRSIRSLPDDLVTGDTAEPGAELESAAAEAGVSPLLLILAACAVVLGMVALWLLVGLLRRGRAKEPAAAGAAAVEREGAPAPPLFNFEDAVDAPSASQADPFGSDLPDPFAETAAPGPEQMEYAAQGDPSFDAPSEAYASAAQGLGETRGPDVNQEISDLLYSPASGTGEDSVFDALPDRHGEVPAPLGETQSQQAAFAASGPDNSDLVQIPDDDSFNIGSAPDADVDSLFAEASASEVHSTPLRPAAPEPLSDGHASADLSSIDLFGDAPADSPPPQGRGSTTRVGLDEVDHDLGGGADSSSVAFEIAETHRAAAPARAHDEGIDIPFALEDPFQNLSGKGSDETAFNTSTAEGLASGGADAETGADERELLQIMEDGDAGASRYDLSSQTGAASGDDLWSATVGGSNQAPAAQPDADSVVSFQEDETAVVEFDDADDADLRTGLGSPDFSGPDADTVTPGMRADAGQDSLPSDPFDRERQRGQEALNQEDWSKAVYHLSIAATLRPEAQEVREELRRARKMKKEQQTG